MTQRYQCEPRLRPRSSEKSLGGGSGGGPIWGDDWWKDDDTDWWNDGNLNKNYIPPVVPRKERPKAEPEKVIEIPTGRKFRKID